MVFEVRRHGVNSMTRSTKALPVPVSKKKKNARIQNSHGVCRSACRSCHENRLQAQPKSRVADSYKCEASAAEIMYIQRHALIRLLFLLL